MIKSNLSLEQKIFFTKLPIKIHGHAAGKLNDVFRITDGYFILLDNLNFTLEDRIG